MTGFSTASTVESATYVLIKADEKPLLDQIWGLRTLAWRTQSNIAFNNSEGGQGRWSELPEACRRTGIGSRQWNIWAPGTTEPV